MTATQKSNVTQSLTYVRKYNVINVLVLEDGILKRRQLNMGGGFVNRRTSTILQALRDIGSNKYSMREFKIFIK